MKIETCSVYDGRVREKHSKHRHEMDMKSLDDMVFTGWITGEGERYFWQHGYSSEIRTEQLIGNTRKEVFAFFQDPKNLERITPDFLNFSIVSDPPDTIAEGTTFQYHLKYHGVPMKWISRITCWDPPVRFVDEQIQGPFQKWHHTHQFTDHEEGTCVMDYVQYEVPGWILAPFIHQYRVRPDVESIFSYRQKRIQQIFSAQHTS